MNTLSAREQFHKTFTEKETSDLAGILNSTPVKNAMVFAVANMTIAGATKEQLDGARLLCLSLLTIAQPITKPEDFKIAELERVPTPSGR